MNLVRCILLCLAFASCGGGSSSSNPQEMTALETMTQAVVAEGRQAWNLTPARITR